jgi:hypothetical protein
MRAIARGNVATIISLCRIAPASTHWYKVHCTPLEPCAATNVSGTSRQCHSALLTHAGAFLGPTPPQVTATRTLTRYKGAGGSAGGDTGELEALELVKYYPAVAFSSEPDAYMTVKSRLKLRRTRVPRGSD